MRGVHRMRPAVWIAVSAVVVVTGLAAAIGSFATAADIASAESARACAVEFDDGCTTERRAVLEYRRAGARRFWRLRWIVSVPDGEPFGSTREGIEVPRQDGESTLHVGDQATLIYLGRAPAWVRTADGVVVETDEHPRRRALFWGLAALGLIGGGGYGVRTALASHRSGRSWWQQTEVESRLGPEVALFLAGMMAVAAAQVSGWVWSMQLAGAAVGGLCGVAIWLRSRNRPG